MFDFLEWYVPWGSLDGPLKLMAVSWGVSLCLGLAIFIYVVILKKPWLSLQHLRSSSEPELEQSENQADVD